MPQTPLLRQGDVLIASIQSALSDKDMIALRERVLEVLSEERLRGVVIDVSVLDVLDSFATRTLCETASAVRLCGAETVIVGIQPEVALSMVLLGLGMADVRTALDLDAGLEAIRGRNERGRDERGWDAPQEGPRRHG